jgi:hypothetical protein
MDKVADVDANAKLHSATIFDPGASGRRRILHCDGAFNCIHHAAKLRQDAIAGGIDHATAMTRDHWKHERQKILQVTDGLGFVGPDQSAVASDVGGENCRQPAGNHYSFAGLRQDRFWFTEEMPQIT